MICRICGTADEHKTYTVQEMMFGTREKFTYFQCLFCGCLQISEYPSDMAAYYPKDYYSYSQRLPAVRALKSGIQDFLRRKRNESRIRGKGLLGKLLLRWKPFDEIPEEWILKLKLPFDAAILDVGCGNGVRLLSLNQLGYQNLAGVDPFIPETCRYPNGVVVHKKELGQMEGQFDLIMFHHSFEHMQNQLAILKQACALLKKNGVCLVRIPTASSYAWEHYGVHWVSLDAPRHYYLHSHESIRFLSSEAGFSLTEISSDSTDFQFYGSEQYLKNIPLAAPESYWVHPEKSIFTAGEVDAFKRRAWRLNALGRGDTIQVFMRKE